jgi:hypothetical protein
MVQPGPHAPLDGETPFNNGRSTAMEEGRDPSGRFGSGNTGRPRGAKGKRPALLRALDDMVSGDAEDIIRGVVKAALDGDTRAAEILLRRIWPEPKGRPITASIDIPKLNGATSLTDAIGAIATAVCKGELSPEEGTAVAGLFDMKRRAHETAEFDERLKRIEQALAERKPLTREETIE